MTATDTGAPAPTHTQTWLRPFSSTLRLGDDGENAIIETTLCPKCRSTDTIVEYHPTVVSGFTCYDLVTGLRITADLAQDDVDTALGTEHLCRACLSCQYAWCEKTADAN
jgi:hypothetical protein